MDVTDSTLITVQDQSQVAEARRTAASVASEIGLEEKIRDRLALVITELATNLVKHTTGGGSIILQGLLGTESVGLEVFALDKSPGMANLEACRQDGFSSVGTFGTGLGSIKRLSDSMEIQSAEGLGTIIQTRFWNSKPSKEERHIGGLNVPLPGELLSGDKWNVQKTPNGIYALLVDGLGHGFEACEAAKLAVTRFKENLKAHPLEMVRILHQSLRGSRGAVGAVALIDVANGRLSFCGLGNISAMIVDDSERKRLTSMNGTLGYENRKTNEFLHPWTPNSSLIMHSDGLSTRAADELESMHITTTPAAIIAASLYLHQTKNTDDATVLVVKNPE